MLKQQTKKFFSKLKIFENVSTQETEILLICFERLNCSEKVFP